jgi:hypothetical protein
MITRGDVAGGEEVVAGEDAVFHAGMTRLMRNVVRRALLRAVARDETWL